MRQPIPKPGPATGPSGAPSSGSSGAASGGLSAGQAAAGQAAAAPEGLLPANASQFSDASLLAATLPPACEALDADMARSLAAVGLVSLRAVVVDGPTLLPSRRWALHDPAAGADAGGDGPADAGFPGAAALVERLQQRAGHETLSHRVSPRRWVLAWPLGAQRVGLAVAHFDTGHPVLGPADAGLVRLVCNAGLRDSAPLPAAPPPAVDHATQHGRRSQQAGRWNSGPSLLLAALAAGGAAWLAWVAVPAQREAAQQQQAELLRLHSMADSTVSRAVTVALASGDYGEVQSALDGFASLGYFEQAVVTNPRNRTVAWVGSALAARIGDPPPDALLRRAVSITLVQGSQPIGRVLIAHSPAVMGLLPSIASLQWQVGVVMALASGAVLLMALRCPQRLRRRSEPPS